MLPDSRNTASPGAGQGAFARAALAWHAAGAVVIPVADKKPLVRAWTQWRGQSAKTVALLQMKHAQAGLGVVTGARSRLTVVDIDGADPALAREAERRFGSSPIEVETPSGGRHLYFRHQGERCATRLDGMKIDIRGAGGFVCAPPTQRSDRPQPYRFIRGSLEDLARLPPMREGALPKPPPLASERKAAPATDLVPHGRRHAALIDFAMRRVRTCQTIDELKTATETHAMTRLEIEPRIGPQEIADIAAWAWGKQQRGENRVGAAGHGAWFPSDEVRALKLHPDAFLLLAVLKTYNGPDAAFWIANEFRHEFGWTLRRLVAARQMLLDLGIVALTRRWTRNSPALYRWNRRAG